MKKSEAYYLAQIAVIASPTIAPENKLEVLKILIDDEKLAEFTERNQAAKAVEE